jgi:hypothetical protein
MFGLRLTRFVQGIREMSLDSSFERLGTLSSRLAGNRRRWAFVTKSDAVSIMTNRAVAADNDSLPD